MPVVQGGRPEGERLRRATLADIAAFVAPGGDTVDQAARDAAAAAQATADAKLSDAPSDGALYGRRDGGWAALSFAETDTLATVTARGATTGAAVAITNSSASALSVTGGASIGGAVSVGGNVTIEKTTPILALDTPSATVAAVDFRRSGTMRWRIAASNAADPNLIVTSYDSSGASLGNAVSIDNATRVVNFPAGIATGSNLLVTNLNADLLDGQHASAFASAAHGHAAGDITSGVIAAARLGTGTATSSTFLRGDGTWATPPVGSHTHSASDITSGVIATARLGSGTASSSTFLRGDQTWSSSLSALTLTSSSSSALSVTGGASIGGAVTTGGNITVAKTTPAVSINATSASNAQIDFQRNGTTRWRVVASSAADPVFNIIALDSSGASLGNAISINNGTRVVSMPGGAAITGDVRFPGVGTTANAANAFLDTSTSPGNQLLRSMSSIRYKTDIQDIALETARTIVENLRPIRYRSRAPADNPDWTWYGLIAEDVAEVDPRLVHWAPGDPENDVPPGPLVPDGVQYERVGVLTLVVVQDHGRRIADLEAAVSALSERVAALEAAAASP